MDIIFACYFQFRFQSNGGTRGMNVCRWTVPFKLNKHNLKLFQALRKANACDCLLKFYSIAVIKCVCLSTFHGTLTVLLLLSYCVCLCIFLSFFSPHLFCCRSSSFPLKINKPHWNIKQTEMKNYSIKPEWHELYFLVLCIIFLSIISSAFASYFPIFLLALCPPLHAVTLQIKLITSTAFIGFNSSNLFYQGFSNGIRNVPLILFICCGEIEISSIYLTHMLAYTRTRIHAYTCVCDINIICRICEYNI